MIYSRYRGLHLDKHNRRLNEHYGNADIKTEFSENNRVYIAPKQSLYKDCKEQIEKRVVSNGGRITKASNWLCECIFSYPEELPLEMLDEYNSLIIKYMNARFDNNVVSAICHLDEGGLPHLHLDILPITEDNRLSAKTLINRDFITSMHRVMPIILRKKGFNIDDHEETEDIKKGGLSAKEYKKRMEQEKRKLNERLNDLTAEYNNLVDKYNSLVCNTGLLERKKELEKEEQRGICR